MNIPPWLVFALLAALTLALLYQIARRHFGKRLIAYWLLTLAGFLGAEALAEQLGWGVTRLGDLRLLPDMTGSLLVLGLLWILGL